MFTKKQSPRSSSLPQQRPEKRNNSSQVFWRLIFVWGILAVSAIALTGRLYVLQVKEVIPVAKDSQLAKNAENGYLRQIAGKTLQEIARSQQTTILRPYTPRRQIVDSGQNVLATDVITYKLYIHPNLFKRHRQPVSPQEVARQLANILETKTEAEFIAYFQNPQKKGIPLPENISESAVQRIRALNIDGLDVRKQYSRVYPHKEAVAEVIGYINDDEQRQPQAGVEYTQDKLLARKPRKLILRRSNVNSGGRNIPIYVPGDLDPDRSFSFDDLRLQLTIDLRLQQSARAALKAKMDEYEAIGGTVIVMDVSDGSILALVCEPTYDPNQYQKYSDYSLFKNWAITDLYEPGSTFKPINIAIALDEGAITPQDKIEDTGTIEIGTEPISNHDYEKKGAKGEITIPKILQDSSNIGMIKIMERIPPEVYYQRLLELGIEEKLELEIPGSAAGTLKDEIEFTIRDIEPAVASFGHGFSLTPLKLIQLHAAIANGGKLVTPHVVRGLSDFEGYLHYSVPKRETEIFDSKTARIVLKMMETVVEEGSGEVVKIPNYRIAGKTGTSEKKDKITNTYAKDAKITSFVGIFPVEKPRYAILAVVDEPVGEDTFGSTVAAPIVGEVIKAIIAHEGIKPTVTKETIEAKEIVGDE